MQTKRIGIVCLPGRGHLYPAAALGRRLQSRGHEVLLFSQQIAKGFVKQAGLNFVAIDDQCAAFRATPSSKSTTDSGPNTVEVIYGHALLMLRRTPEIIHRLSIDVLLIDQADIASGTVADFLDIPFLNLSFLPPLYLNDDCPPFIYDWGMEKDDVASQRNRRGNLVIQRLLRPVLSLVNSQRSVWKLPHKGNLNEVFSSLAVITQMPQVLDFPRPTLPSHFFYTGPFFDGRERSNVKFPWHRLNGKPVVYASMGTVRNRSLRVFQIIAAAVAAFDVQLVLSLGGMALIPEDLVEVAGDPVVVHYAPQVEILKKASLTICHAGINTTLESISNGVPIIAIPVNDDQPGMAARIKWLGLGQSIPIRQLSVDRLQQCMAEVLREPRYGINVRRMSGELRNIDGLGQAVSVIERTLNIA